MNDQTVSKKKMENDQKINIFVLLLSGTKNRKSLLYHYEVTNSSIEANEIVKKLRRQTRGSSIGKTETCYRNITLEFKEQEITIKSQGALQHYDIGNLSLIKVKYFGKCVTGE